jgi:hypothetical protein
MIKRNAMAKLQTYSLCYWCIFSITASLTSCGKTLPLRKKHTQPLNSQFKGKFVNKSFSVTGRNPYQDNTSILQELEIFPNQSETIRIEFDKNNQLYIHHQEDGDTITSIFDGKFKRNGSYQIWLRRKRIEIPPLFPIIYSRIDIKRLSLVLDLENNLVIHNKWARTANIFILAGGASAKYNSFYYLKTELFKLQ